MEDSITLGDAAADLGLTAQNGDVFFGRRRGFAIGFKVIDPQGHALALFQIRHPFAADAPELKAVGYDAEISRAIADKKIELESADKMIWLTFVDCGRELVERSIGPMLDRVLDSLSAAGVAGADPELCHYCRRVAVKELTCRDGKVAQICPACLGEKTGAMQQQSSVAGEGRALGFLLSMAALIGAVGWAVCWGVYDRIFYSSDATVIHIPVYAVALASFCAAVATGAPVGVVLKRFRPAGQRTGAAAIACVIAAALVGELASIAWLIYREFGIMDLKVAWQNFLQLEQSMGSFHLAGKAIGLVLAAALARDLSKPPKPAVKL